MSLRGGPLVFHCGHTTTSCLCSPHAWSHQQVHLPGQNSPSIEHLLKPLEDVIHNVYLLAITGQNAFRHALEDLALLTHSTQLQLDTNQVKRSLLHWQPSS